MLSFLPLPLHSLMIRKAIALLSLSAGFLFHSCEPEPGPSCVEMVATRYSRRSDVIVNGTHLLFPLSLQDTLIFNYHGHDTLIFRRTDSLGVRDTITFIGTGKIYSRTGGSIYIAESCYASYGEENRDISFVPVTGGEVLKFNLNASGGVPSFKYEYMGFTMNDIVIGVGHSQLSDYMPVFTVDSIEFYKVTRLSKNTPKGHVEYYLNKTHQLFYFKIDGEEYLRID